LSVDPAWLLLLLGGAFTASLTAVALWLQRIHGQDPVPPERCLVCETVVRPALSGAYRCPQCGFDLIHARQRYPGHCELLRTLQTAHDRLARERRWYQTASPAGAFEEVLEIPRPHLADAVRDVLYSAPDFLGPPHDPADAALLRDVHGLLDDIAATTDPFTGAYEADRRRALALLDARDHTLTRLARAVATRLAAALRA
jgi:hypothetical protein